MVSGLTRNQVPGNRLRVRIPCPPLMYLTDNSELPTIKRRKLFDLRQPVMLCIFRRIGLCFVA